MIEEASDPEKKAEKEEPGKPAVHEQNVSSAYSGTLPCVDNVPYVLRSHVSIAPLCADILQDSSRDATQ